MHDMGQGPGVFPHGRNVGHAADVDAAVAHEHADARLLVGHVQFRRQLLGAGQGGRARRSGSWRLRLTRPRASMTDWGMSLGPWKTPQT